MIIFNSKLLIYQRVYYFKRNHRRKNMMNQWMKWVPHFGQAMLLFGFRQKIKG
jgi:hypothetical protein